MKDFTKRRRMAAETRFASHLFGLDVEEVHHLHAGVAHEFCRTVLFCGEAPGSPCFRGHFYVRFRPGSASIEESYAMIDGCLVGSHPIGARARRTSR